MSKRSRAATVSVAAAAAAAERPSLAGLDLGHVNNSDSNIDSTPKNHSFESRRSRDDLALALKKSNNVRAYHVPIRGRPPSPDASLRSSSTTQVTMVRTATPDSLGESGETGVIAIGMAIGSPTQAPDNMAWSRPKVMPATMGISEPPLQMPEPEAQPEPEPEQKQEKTRKWGLFRSKSKRTRPPEPQRTMSDMPNPSTTSLSSVGYSGKNGSKVDQSSKAVPKHKPIVINRSQTEPVMDRGDQSEGPVATSAKPTSETKLTREKSDAKSLKESKATKEPTSGGLGRKMSLRVLRGDSKARRAEREQPAPMPSPPPMPQPLPQLTGPLLDVDIPSIKMERYSVMFNGVLQPQKSSTSALLARRQATLDRLKALDSKAYSYGIDASRPRRATSPQPKASPSFEQDSEKLDANLMLSPRHRSNTSPALMASPITSAFFEEPQKQNEATKARVVHVSRPKEVARDRRPSQPSQNKPVLVSKFSKQAPLPVPAQRSRSPPARKASPPSTGLSDVPRSNNSSPFRPDTSSLVLDSPASSDDDDDAEIIRKLQSSFPTPRSTKFSPPASTASLSPTTTRKPSPPPMVTSADANSVARPSTPDPEKALKNAVEVSIARQISVSHQQRRMLHPLKSNPSLRRRNEGGPGAKVGTYIPIEVDERLAEIPTATPRVVHPMTHANSPDTWEMHRKSSRVILEGP